VGVLGADKAVADGELNEVSVVGLLLSLLLTGLFENQLLLLLLLLLLRKGLLGQLRKLAAVMLLPPLTLW